MKMFSGWVTIAVNDLDAAARWYAEKFHLENQGYTADGDSGYCVVGSSDMETRFLLLPKDEGEYPDRPILNTANAAKAREWLLARGVTVGPVETDIQGTSYIEMHDLEGNMVEICEEPGN